MKGYFFTSFGDLFVHFLHFAADDIGHLTNPSPHNISFKKSNPVSINSLQHLFEMLIRTSSANNDPYKEDIECKFDTSSIYEQVYMIKRR